MAYKFTILALLFGILLLVNPMMGQDDTGADNAAADATDGGDKNDKEKKEEGGGQLQCYDCGECNGKSNLTIQSGCSKCLMVWRAINKNQKYVKTSCVKKEEQCTNAIATVNTFCETYQKGEDDTLNMLCSTEGELKHECCATDKCNEKVKDAGAFSGSSALTPGNQIFLATGLVMLLSKLLTASQ